MIPYGKNKKFKYNYKNCNPKKLGKGWRNWWEVELGGIIKKSERQKTKKEIKKQLNEK